MGGFRLLQSRHNVNFFPFRDACKKLPLLVFKLLKLVHQTEFQFGKLRLCIFKLGSLDLGVVFLGKEGEATELPRLWHDLGVRPFLNFLRHQLLTNIRNPAFHVFLVLISC